MKSILTLSIVLLGLAFTYLLVGKTYYSGPATEMGISEGPDLNVPYHEKYGVFGYAYARDYFSNSRVVERRIESLSLVRLAVSIAIISTIWFLIGLFVSRGLMRGKTKK